MQNRFRQNFFFLTMIFSAMQAPSPAADWGYEGAPELPAAQRGTRELKAPPPALIVSPSDKSKSKPSSASQNSSGANSANATKAGTTLSTTTPVVRPFLGTETSSSDRVDFDKQASVCWLQLFQIAAKSPLSFEQQKRFEDYMLAKAKLGGKHADEVRSILKFWPKLINGLRDKPELEEGYVALFHALLRIRESMPPEQLNVSGEIKCDSDLITELLGVQRIAVAAEPPLTEEAVNAYADLTCFIYEQKNPGKTVDADDNRALLARVVADKFRAAPTEADRKAMAHFDLSWAKFKILWDNADEPTRKAMLEKLNKTGTGSSLSMAKDRLLDEVLSSWPWPVHP